MGDYIGLDLEEKVEISKMIGRRERVIFASTAYRYNRKFLKALKEIIITESNIYLIGRQANPNSIGLRRKFH